MMPRRSLLLLLVAALVTVGAATWYLARRSGARKPLPSAAPAAPLAGGIRTPAFAPFDGPRFPKASVVVISIDTLRRDHLAPYGAAFETPAATRLAREGVVFGRALTQVPLTLPSHATLFTGLYPPHHGVRDNGGFVLKPDVTTLAEQFKRAGYATAGFVASYVLHSRGGIAQGHDTYDDQFDYVGIESRALVDVERPAGLVVDAALAWLRQPGRGQRPFYLWVHLYDPHHPYEPPEAFRGKGPTPYAGEVMYADAQAGRILEALDALDLRRHSVVVYLSDHGEALGEHGEPTHGIFLYGPSIDVPLIIAPPAGGAVGTPPVALAGRHVRGVVQLVDVTPTLLDLVALPVPPGLDGVSLLPMLRHEEVAPAQASDPTDAIAGPAAYAETFYPRFHYNWSELTAVETGRWKFVKAPRAELYDLRNDPKELKDATAEHPEIAATLARHLEAVSLRDAGAEPTPSPLAADERAKLQALGYVSGAESGGTRRRGPRPDPKDGLPLLQELLKAQTDRDAGRLTEALGRLESLAQRDPENPSVYVTLSTVYDRMKDPENSIRAAKRAVALDPESAVAVLDLAFAFKGAGLLEEAATGFERVLALEPGNLKALLNLGEIDQARGHRERALEIYQRAIATAPRSARAHISAGSVALELKRLPLAEKLLKQAVALGGAQPDLHFNLGLMAEMKGRPTVALQEYRAEVAAYPDSLGAWVNLGLLERQAGRVDAALAAFEKAAAARADAMEGPYLMAETLAQLGRKADADRSVQEALRRAPGDPRVQQLAQRIRR